MKLIIKIIIQILIIFMTIIMLHKLNSYKLPPIYLPKLAQHNTFGELPIIEMADDKVFSEIDGGEYLIYKDKEQCYEDVKNELCRFNNIETICKGSPMVCEQKKISRKELKLRKIRQKKCIEAGKNACDIYQNWQEGNYGCSEVFSNWTCYSNIGFN